MSDNAEYVKEILEEIADALGIGAEVSVNETEDAITAEYVGEDAGAIIGHHGNTLDAVQHLTQRMVFQGERSPKSLSVDAAGYRERRRAKLQGLADQAADTALRERREVKMEPMSAQERKVVHERLKDRHDVATFSEGDEPGRRLVVAPGTP